jgi:hypothetical protein
MTDTIYKIINSHKKTFNKIIKLSLNYSINFNPILTDHINNLQIYNNTTNQYESGTFYFIGLSENNKFTWYDPFRLTLKPLAKKMISGYLGPKNKKYKDILVSLFNNRINEFEKKNIEIIPLLISLFLSQGEVIKVISGNNVGYFYAQIPSFNLPNKLYYDRNKILSILKK